MAEGRRTHSAVASGTGMDVSLRVAWSYPQITHDPHAPPKEGFRD